MRTEYKAGDLLTRDDIGLVFRDGVGEQMKIVCIDSTRTPDKIVVAVNKEQNRFDTYYLNGYFDNREEPMEYDLASFVGASFTDEIQDKTITEKEYLKDKLEVLESKIDFILAKLDSITRDMIIIHHDIQRGLN